MNPYIEALKKEYQDALQHYTQELGHIRTGHANPELLDGIMVNSYESMLPIKQVASITVPEPKMIVNQPWDKGILKEIEKAISNAKIGFSPVNDGNVIRLPMPPMTEENRRDLVKILNQKAEKARISIRQLRDKVKESILKAEKAKEIPEDEMYKYLKQLDEFTGEQTEKMNLLAAEKEKKIMQI